MPYTSNRPFFANFFAAFRAQPYPKGPAAVTSAATTASPSTASPASAAPGQQSQPRTITTKSQPGTTSSTAAAVAAHAFQSARSPPPRPQSSSPRPAPHSPAPPRSPPHSSSLQRSRTPSRGRRGSESSSDGGGGGGGFKDLRGPQNWYIGGRAPNGEERFYQLGMVRRYRSADRLSLDRLSL